MKFFYKLTLLIIISLFPIIGNSQKTIKRNTGPSKERVITSKKKKTSTSKKPKAQKSNISAGKPSAISSCNHEHLIEKLLSNMIPIEGGNFLMGSEDEEALTWEKPVHLENVESFKIGKFEVTQKEWMSIMEENPSQIAGENLPVQGVSLDECLRFIAKINEISGLNFRLPSETEWEFAARGGNLSKGYIYSGSNDIDEVAWYSDNCENNIHEIGLKKPNELGIYDMSGNVWEWTDDQFSINYRSPRKGIDKVIRGGSWINEKKECRVSNRYKTSPKAGGLSYGFRLALDAN